MVIGFYFTVEVEIAVVVVSTITGPVVIVTFVTQVESSELSSRTDCFSDSPHDVESPNEIKAIAVNNSVVFFMMQNKTKILIMSSTNRIYFKMIQFSTRSP